MSKTVVSNVSCTYGNITGNVSSISSSTTTVPDQSDLDSLERRLNSKIQTLENKIIELSDKNEVLTDALKSVISKYSSLSSGMVSEIKTAIAAGNSNLRDILNNEMK